MKSKKIAVALIAVVFSVIVICSILTAFTVRKVNAEFSVRENSYGRTDEVKAILDKAIGQNLLFVDLSAIKAEIEKDAYIEVVSIERNLPDAVTVKIRERTGVYVYSSDGKNYLLTEDGLVLSEYGGEETRELISLKTEGVDLGAPVIGNYLGAGNNAFFTALSLGKRADLTDCVKTLTVIDETERKDLIFGTYTSVDIVIEGITDDGERKTDKAFALYDSADDFVKSENEILAYKDAGGNIVAVWTKHGA